MKIVLGNNMNVEIKGYIGELGYSEEQLIKSASFGRTIFFTYYSHSNQ